MAGCDFSIRHLLYFFAASFYRGTMSHLCHHGTKVLVAGMDDKINRRFWFNYFFIKTEHVVANPRGFSEQWNFARKYFCYLKYVHSLSFVFYDPFLSSFFFCVAKRHPPSLVADISDWVARVLPYTVGIRD